MKILKIQPSQFFNSNATSERRNMQVKANNNSINMNYATLPLGNIYGSKISFTGTEETPKKQKFQSVPDIDFGEYQMMSPARKRRFQKKYMEFSNDKAINLDELVDQKFKYLPLRNEKDMDDFIKISKVYSKYKDQPIVCLGRSPKWFLNAALWMKDGIQNYTFVAFSKFWFMPDKVEGYRRSPYLAPTEVEETAYRNYLRNIEATPLHMVKKFEETGKKTVITDYICSGKGACSFLDLMSRFAEDQGVLERFSKSIQIVGIGSRDYMEQLAGEDGDISDPRVFMPEKLRPYSKNIKQEFYNMPFRVFEEMLLNQNTNECRSTFYPHDAWTIYRPDQFKTGLIKDLKKVELIKAKFPAQFSKTFGKEPLSSFAPAMRDFRNLLNFRILNALDERGLLKAFHKTKI